MYAANGAWMAQGSTELPVFRQQEHVDGGSETVRRPIIVLSGYEVEPNGPGYFCTT